MHGYMHTPYTIDGSIMNFLPSFLSPLIYGSIDIPYLMHNYVCTLRIVRKFIVIICNNNIIVVISMYMHV